MGARRSLCRAPALSLSSGPGALSVGAQRSLSGPSGLCVGARRSLLKRRSLSGSVSGPGGPPFGLRRFVSRPGALCVAVRRSLCQGSVCSVSGPGAALSGFVSGPGALCVGPWLWLSLSLCRAPALFVPGPDSVARRSSSNALCVGFRCSLSGSVLAWRSSPNVLFVGPRLSLFRGPALSLRGPCHPCGVVGVPGMSAGCPPPCHPQTMLRSRHRKHVQPLAGNADAYTGQFHQGTSSPTVVCTRISPAATSLLLRTRLLCHLPSRATKTNNASVPIASVLRAPSSDPRATHPVLGRQLRSTFQSFQSCGPPAPIRVPPIRPGAFPFSRREPQTLLFGG